MEIICYACGRGENPENTLEGIRHCLTVNPDWFIEMDLQWTGDGRLILFHDYNTLRVTGVDARVDELNLEEIQKLDAGYHFKGEKSDQDYQVPTLTAVMDEFPKARIVLDLHSDEPEAVNRLIELVERYNRVVDTVIVSHYDAVINQLRQEKPDWVYGVPKQEAKKIVYSSFLGLDGLFSMKSDILMLPEYLGSIKILRKRVRHHARKRNRKLWTWVNEGEHVKNIDTVEELDHMLSLGVDGVFVDRPMRLLKEMM